MLNNMDIFEDTSDVIVRNLDKVLILMQTGIFEMKNGSITIHFDGQGKIRKVERHDIFNIS